MPCPRCSSVALTPLTSRKALCGDCGLIVRDVRPVGRPANRLRTAAAATTAPRIYSPPTVSATCPDCGHVGAEKTHSLDAPLRCCFCGTEFHPNDMPRTELDQRIAAERASAIARYLDVNRKPPSNPASGLREYATRFGRNGKGRFEAVGAQRRQRIRVEALV